MRRNGSCRWASIPSPCPTSEKADLLLSISAGGARRWRGLLLGVAFRRARGASLRQQLRRRILQTRTRIAPGLQRHRRRQRRRPYRVARQSHARRAAPAGNMWRAPACSKRRGWPGEQARAKLHAKPVVAGDYDVVIDPTNLWLTIHETVGHSTELDRVLGWEANFAGTTFVKPAMLNNLRFGTELMTIVADRSQEGGLVQHRLRRRRRAARTRGIRDRLKGRVPQFSDGARTGASTSAPSAPTAAPMRTIRPPSPFSGCPISRSRPTRENARSKI